jgi:hypothetical protein
MVEARDPSLAPSRPGLLFDPPHADRGPLNLTVLSAPSRTCSANLGIGRVAAAATAARGAYLILVVATSSLGGGDCCELGVPCAPVPPHPIGNQRPAADFVAGLDGGERVVVV